MAVKRSRVGKAFGIALREAREASQITQEELAGRASYASNYISLLETARRQPTISAIIALEQALALPPGDLVRQTVLSLKQKRTR